MPTPFVNGRTIKAGRRAPSPTARIAVAALAVIAIAGCSSADGRPRDTKQDATTQAGAPKRDAAADSLLQAADRGRIDGAPSAKVWVVEVSDLQCPYCKEWHDRTYPIVRDEYVKTGKIRLAYVNYPLPQHHNAQAASSAAMCASVQGKFWAMHDALFTSQEDWEKLSNPNPFFESLAAKAGVNMTTWKSCVATGAMAPLISADIDRARRAGVQSTPTFIVGGRLMEGAIPPDEMRKAINDALAR